MWWKVIANYKSNTTPKYLFIIIIGKYSEELTCSFEKLQRKFGKTRYMEEAQKSLENVLPNLWMALYYLLSHTKFNLKNWKTLLSLKFNKN